jgi:hypothetical protein
MALALEDTDRWDREPEVAHPDEYTADDNWRTAFEFGGER